MKHRIISLTLGWLCAALTVWAQTPAWVMTHPTSDDAYIGIGAAPLSDADHVKKATQLALSDIAAQIALKVDNQSFLHTVDVDGKSRELFEDKIQTNLTTWLEGQELKDSYRSTETYYVCYSLNKEVYAQNAEKRRQQVTQQGLTYLKNGRAAEESLDLIQAIQLYAKGLETVEAWTFMDLTANGNVNVPAALYSAYLNVFSGMVITTNVTQVEGEAFKAVKSPIAGCLSRNGEPLPNVTLKATFATGSGATTSATKTDFNGTAEFYITNITSKDPVQELVISIDDQFFSTLPKAYRTLIMRQSLPAAKVTVTVKPSGNMAYIYINEQHDIEGLERAITTTLGNNHFKVTENPDGANVFIDFSTKMDLGAEVTGGTYNLNTNICTMVLKFYNNATEELLLTYSVSNLKVLTPVHMSAEETYAACVREIMKRVNRELPSRLKKITLN